MFQLRHVIDRLRIHNAEVVLVRADLRIRRGERGDVDLLHQGASTLGDLAYGYDLAGRRTGVWGSFGRTGLPAATTATASYNANNQLASWNGTSPTYDPNGNLTGFGSQTYTWNDRNQLSATSAGSASFSYDGLGRRLSKTIGGTTTKFLYDGANVVQEQNSSNTATANLLTGLGIDEVFARQVVGGATSSLLTDALGSTIALGDANGALQTSYTYEPFGAVITSGTTNTNSYQFTGRENDGSTGLYFYRARYYNPTFGRFMSEDPLGFPGGPDSDLYSYVRNSPVILVDPFGLEPSSCGFLGIGCAVRFLSDHSSSIMNWVIDNRWELLTAVSAITCMTPAAVACLAVTGGVFLLKEVEIYTQAGGFNAEFLKSSLYNAATTTVTIVGGGLLSKAATKGTYAAIQSRWGGQLFYKGLPTAICAGIEACASPHWPPG